MTAETWYTATQSEMKGPELGLISGTRARACWTMQPLR